MSFGLKIRGKRESSKLSHLPKGEFRKLMTQLAVEVKFGVPSKKCDNYGICQIDRTDVLLDKQAELPACLNCARKAKAVMGLYARNRIELAFPKSSMSNRVRETIFENPRFLIEEDYCLPDTLAAEDPSEDEKWIFKAGQYPILESDGFYFIYFY